MNPLTEGVAWSLVAFAPVVVYLAVIIAGGNPSWPWAVLMLLIHAPAFTRAEWCFLIKAGGWRHLPWIKP